MSNKVFDHIVHCRTIVVQPQGGLNSYYWIDQHTYDIPVCCIWYATILFIVTLLFMWLGLCEYYLQPSQVSLLNNTNLHLSWKGHIGLRHNRFQNNLDRVNLQMCARLFMCSLQIPTCSLYNHWGLIYTI